MRRNFVHLTQRSRLEARARGIKMFERVENFTSSSEFDDFVATKRNQAEFEAFDQRCERAYRKQLQLHKAELWNSLKRRLKLTNRKLDENVLLEAQSLIEERSEWLRDVWAQIDSDYRSGDNQRSQRAAREISEALQGQGPKNMKRLYDEKHEARFGGTLTQQESESTSLQSPIQVEEVTRYNNLKMNMSRIQDSVLEKFGASGKDHWMLLEQAKDDDYEKKIGNAAEVYRKLLVQQSHYDAVQATENDRSLMARMHRAQVRFKGAMELEREREDLTEAHRVMQDERADVEKEQRLTNLRLAAQLRAEGKNAAEVAAALKFQAMERVNGQQVKRSSEAHSEMMDRKRKFLDLIQDMEEDIDSREGRKLLEKEKSESLIEEAKRLSSLRSNQTTKQALWELINRDKFEDPFLVAHQARLDAQATYSEVYQRTKPWQMRLGPKSKQNEGSTSQGQAEAHRIYKSPNVEDKAFNWGMQAKDVFKLDHTPGRDYVISSEGVHVQDPKTLDIDRRFEKKGGRGAVWTGPRYYKLSEPTTQLESEFPRSSK